MSNANADQIDFWNNVQADKWVRLQARMDETLGPIGDEAARRLAVRAGESVLDIGAGCGGTTLGLAESAGGTGSVTAVDIATAMLELARSRAESRDLDIDFVEADAQTHRFGADRFDAVFSRFGVMFFANPVAAFANILGAAKPGGRLSLAAWRERRDNPWAMIGVQAARDHVELPPRPAPDDPGQFAFEDEARVRTILTDAGWADIALDRFDTDLTLGADVEEAVAFSMQMGPAAPALAEADETTRQTVADNLRDLLVPHAGNEGVRMSSSSWIISAVKPA